MIPTDAGQVAEVLLRPVRGVVAVAGLLVLQVAGPHHLQGLGPVEVHAGGGLDVEPGLGVEDRDRERHVDAPEGVHHVGELVEVERDGVLDGDPEVLFDGRHQLGETFEQPGVDLVGPVAAGVGDEQVAGDGQEGQPMVGRVGVEDHDHVAVHPVDALGAQPVGRVLHGEGAARGGPHHQDVLGAGLLAGGERSGQSFDLDAFEVVGEVVGVARPAGHQHQEHAQTDDQPQSEPVPTLGLLALGPFGRMAGSPVLAFCLAHLTAQLLETGLVRYGPGSWHTASR